MFLDWFNLFNTLLVDNPFRSCLKSYNPVLWGVPKGSYASIPNGSCRIIEFRKMVQVYVCLTRRFSITLFSNSDSGVWSCLESLLRSIKMMYLMAGTKPHWSSCHTGCCLQPFTCKWSLWWQLCLRQGRVEMFINVKNDENFSSAEK